MAIAAAVDPVPARGFDPSAMAQPPHIYASTVSRRGRRWNRRRALWPFALACVAAVAVAALVAAVLL
jgi:anti-sigma-K factor RskA